MATPDETLPAWPLSEEAVARIGSSRIFLGHQSVGANVLDGLRMLIAADPRLNLRIVSTDNPASVTGPAFFEACIGENRRPESKDIAFAAALDRGMGREGGIAGYKYCYIDVAAETGVETLFDSYSRNIESLRARYPLLRFLHITMPLTTDYEPSGKVLLKSMLGRVTARELNHRRNRFNSFLRSKFSDADTVFDLEQVESTNLDGSRCRASLRGKTVFALSPDLASDSGHLNETGALIAAKRLLMKLAEMASAS